MDDYQFQEIGAEITPVSSFSLFGIEIDNKLSFDKHISNLWVKASWQSNAICVGCNITQIKKEKKQILSNSNYKNIDLVHGILILNYAIILNSFKDLNLFPWKLDDCLL